MTTITTQDGTRVEKLSEGGQIQQCGWLTDTFGVSWQIVPTLLGEMLQDKDGAKAERVMKAMLQMKSRG